MKILKFFLNTFLFFLVILLIFSVGLVGAFYAGLFNFEFGVVVNQIAGTGSMYPTFPKADLSNGESIDKIVAEPEMQLYPNGIFINGERYFGHKITRGDIVAFENTKTKELTQSIYGKTSGYVKRIVGMSGETIQLRDGKVYINDKVLFEPYIATPVSTYGAEFLDDCKVLKIPDNKYFVLGDNRKGSLDSRSKLGFIDEGDIKSFISYSNQIGLYDKNWRNIEEIAEEVEVTFDPVEFINLVNDQRKLEGLPDLSLSTELNESSRIRAEEILESKKSVSISSSEQTIEWDAIINQTGYLNSFYRESYQTGRYSTSELFDYMFSTKENRDIFLSTEYQDIGISQVTKDIDGCNKTVIVNHLGGFESPEFSSDEIESIKKKIESLNEAEPGWESLIASTPLYFNNKVKIDRVNELIDQRKATLIPIYEKISNNQPITREDMLYLYRVDDELITEQNQLSKELNAIIARS